MYAPRYSLVMLRLFAAMAAACCLPGPLVAPMWAQSEWNDARTLALVHRATELRERQLADTALHDWRANAHGYLTFLAQLGEGFTEPPKTIPRVPGESRETDSENPNAAVDPSGGPYVEWLNAIKSGTPALSNFASSGPFSETVLLGNLALRIGKRIEWDAKTMVAKNAPEAATIVRRAYRKGWELA